LLLEERRRLPGHLRVGVVGLGVGTLAAYGRAGDYYRFYEINPDVYKLSSGSMPTFTFLADSPAKTDVQLGDARRLLEAEANRGEWQNFDVLVLDAFNSDSIPVHLLTQEAVELYLKHLNNPDGVLAVHISNRSLDLAPVLAGIAKRFQLKSAVVDYRQSIYQASLWVLLSRNRAILQLPLLKEHALYGPPSTHEELWTDDYSNLLRLIKWPK
jgi:spermidine synthase